MANYTSIVQKELKDGYDYLKTALPTLQTNFETARNNYSLAQSYIEQIAAKIREGMEALDSDNPEVTIDTSDPEVAELVSRVQDLINNIS